MVKITEEKIYAVEGSLEIDFSSVPFDKKKDFEKIKREIRIFARKIIDDYNDSGEDLDFVDNTTGEYID